jgi:hypothetical protein
MQFRETKALYCANRMKHTNTLCGQNARLLLCIKQVVYVEPLSFKGLNIAIDKCFIEELKVKAVHILNSLSTTP